MSDKRSARAVRVESQAKAIIGESYDDFCDGLKLATGKDLAAVGDNEKLIKNAFYAGYGLLEWSRILRSSSAATVFLAELDSSLVTSLALTSSGIYEVGLAQLRYTLECGIGYLYFRDHPRELELALNDADVWEHSRPRSCTTFFRRLPEYRCDAGVQALAEVDRVYGELSAFVHPRTVQAMGQRKYLAEIAQDAARCKLASAKVLAVAKAVTVLFHLANMDLFMKQSEIGQCVLVHCLSRNDRLALEAEHQKRAK